MNITKWHCTPASKPKASNLEAKWAGPNTSLTAFFNSPTLFIFSMLASMAKNSRERWPTNWRRSFEGTLPCLKDLCVKAWVNTVGVKLNCCAMDCALKVEEALFSASKDRVMWMVRRLCCANKMTLNISHSTFGMLAVSYLPFWVCLCSTCLKERIEKRKGKIAKLIAGVNI